MGGCARAQAWQQPSRLPRDAAPTSDAAPCSLPRRALALRLRAASAKMGGAGPGRGRFRTDDVVRDAPLPEFRLDLSTLAAAFAPVRPLRPKRKPAKRLQATVPRDTQLVVTVQRASNLPRRMAAAGGGVRAQSPNRATARASAGRFVSRELAPAGGAGGAGAPWEQQQQPRDARAQQQAAFLGSGAWRGGDEQDDDEPDGGGALLSCFVEVVFRGRRQRTGAVDGGAPIWNEQLAFALLDAEADASPAGLAASDGVITVSLFDEVVTPGAAAKAARAAARAGGAGARARPCALRALARPRGGAVGR